MRFLLFTIMLIGCSHQKPMKYKYFAPNRSIASTKDESNLVSSSHLTLRDFKLFASGVDSTYLMVKLYNSKGEQLVDLDPSTLSLLSSEDIEAKPFTLKQGIYKSQIMPRLKSPSLRLQILWYDKPFESVLTLQTTQSPLSLEVDKRPHENHEIVSRDEVNFLMESETRSEGFEVENIGPNKITGLDKSNSHRTFKFNYQSQAKQNLNFEVEDAVNSNVDHMMNSHFMIFPRKKLFTIEEHNGLLVVNLPNGEEIIFEKESKEIVSGAFEENPMDNNPDRFKRSFPGLHYKGQDVVLRVNARGQVPQIGQYETSQIDNKFGESGSVDVLIINGKTGERCIRPKNDFWEPIDVYPIEFKFPTDEEFDHYLKNKCGFGLPRF